MTLVIDLIVQKENIIKREEEKQERCWEKIQQPPLLRFCLLSFHSVFLSLGSLRRNNSSFGSSGFDPWLSAGCPAAQGGGKKVVWMTGV